MRLKRIHIVAAFVLSVCEHAFESGYSVFDHRSKFEHFAISFRLLHSCGCSTTAPALREPRARIASPRLRNDRNRLDLSFEKFLDELDCVELPRSEKNTSELQSH